MNDNTLPPDDLRRDLTWIGNYIASQIWSLGFVRIDMHLNGMRTRIQVELTKPYGDITDYWCTRLEPETRILATRFEGGHAISKDFTQKEPIVQGNPMPEWAYFVVHVSYRGLQPHDESTR